MDPKDANDNKPMTVGELRKRLADMGNPWIVDPNLADDDPVPDYSRGALPTEDPKLTKSAKRNFKRALRQPPSNPLVRERWSELGLLPRIESLAQANRDERSNQDKEED